MYKFLDEYLVLSICEYNDINDTICLLKSNILFYKLLFKFNNRFRYAFINDNQLCVKCFLPIKQYSVIFICDNHYKYPTFHIDCYSNIPKKNYQIDKCMYCKNSVFVIKTENIQRARIL